METDWKKECICATCETKFIPKGNVARLKYCSRNCMKVNKAWLESQRQAKLGKEAWNKGLPNTWAISGFHLSEETKKKISLAKRGVPSPRNKGLTPKNKLERNRFRTEMQKRIFERDDYTCQLCGVKGGDLQVDHIQSWAEYVELRFSMDNCRTLCASCHYLITFGRSMPDNIKLWGHNHRNRERSEDL